MPPTKKFFKTLLKRGKSKQDISSAAPEFVMQTPEPEEEEEVEDDEDGHCMEGKLPKEFLDTWVSSTTHQLMDEMDFALRGVWPYDDKKEEITPYHRKSSSNDNLAESSDDPMTTLKKKKSKHQVSLSAWSDRGSIGASSSNFILKEKTKKSSAGSTSSGSLHHLNQLGKSKSGENSPAQKRQSRVSPSRSSERRASQDLGLTELDGSLPKTKFREQFLQKLQKDGQSANGSQQLNNSKRTSLRDSAGDRTILKKKHGSSEMLSTTSSSRGHNTQWDGNHQASRILKNGSNNSTPNGTMSKSKKTPPIVSHGRQASVPSSTHSESSSGQSGDFRNKEELLEGKVSPSSSNPHDSGYDSGTIRCRKEVISEFNHRHNDGYSAGTMRPKKEFLSQPSHSRESGFDSSTMHFKSGGALSSAEYSTLKRVKRSPTLSLRSASRGAGSGSGMASAIDSIPLCFDQLTAMNVSTLQQLCAGYIQTQKQLAFAQEEVLPAETGRRWHDIGLIDELEPIFSSTKLVLYKAYWRQNPQETFTIMLSLREPVKYDLFKSNLMKTRVIFEANVSPHLIPASLYAGKKFMKNTAPATTKETTPIKVGETKTITAQHVRNHSTPTFHAQHTENESLLSNKSQGVQSRHESIESSTRLVTSKELKQPTRLESIESSTRLVTSKELKQPTRLESIESSTRLVTSKEPKQPSRLQSVELSTPSVTNNGQVPHSRLESTDSFASTAIARGISRDSVFSDQTSRDTTASLAESQQEQAAIDSILMAIAGEEQEPTVTAPTRREEPAKLASSRMGSFTSPVVKKPVAERYISTMEAFTVKKPAAAERYIPTRINDRTNNNTGQGSFDKLIPGLKTSGLVRNRIANLNSNNNNNIDDELNSNNNNNLDDLLPSSSDRSGGDFVFANHFLEMAGEDLPQMADDRPDSTTAPTSRGAEGLTRCEDKVSSAHNVTCYVTILPTLSKVESIKTYLERLRSEERNKDDLEMDVIFVLLQVLNIVFGLHESQLRLDSISSADFLVVTDPSNSISTVHCHMLNVAQAPNQKIGLTCEKLRMFLMQISHSTPSLQKSVIFTTVDDLIQNAEDLGDLRTISAILQYLLWGPKEDEVKVITLTEHRRQAFELWLQLARGKLVSSLAIKSIDNLKSHMVTSFLANTNGSELFKITKLLNTY